MENSFVPVFESRESNRIVGYLNVDKDTFLSTVIEVDGVQRVPVTLRNGTVTSVGELTNRLDIFGYYNDDLSSDLVTTERYYCIVCLTKDDASLVEGAINSRIPERDIREAAEWVETGRGQYKNERMAADDFKHDFIYVV